MMGGLRSWMFLDDHAEEVRQRVVRWEHHEAKGAETLAASEQELNELRAMIEDLHVTEEELRYVNR